MQVRGHDVAVCSWSLLPKAGGDIVASLQSVGLNHVHLALLPLLNMEPAARTAAIERIGRSVATITATMIGFPGENYSTIAMIRQTGGLVPAQDWPQRRDLVVRASKLTRELGVKYLTMHMGFAPPAAQDEYRALIERIRDVAAAADKDGVTLLLETGQETAAQLAQFLVDAGCSNVGVNFDPANMILYGAGDPIQAIDILGRHIQRVHIKDAIASAEPRIQWGKEVPFGTGQVEPKRFLDALQSVGFTGALAIEREAGPNRVADVRAAVAALLAAE